MSEKKKKTGGKSARKTGNTATKKPARKSVPKKTGRLKGSPAANALKKKTQSPYEEKTSPYPAETIKQKPANLIDLLNEDGKHENGTLPATKDKIEPEEEVDPAALHRGDLPMTLVDHLDEFRSRLLVTLVTLIVLTIGCFFFSDFLLEIINRPFLQTGQKLNIFNLTGGFMIRMKVSFFAALLIGLPVPVVQLWRFILPALSITDRKFSRIAITSTIILFYAGLAFVFFLIVPYAIPVLLSFVSKDMNSLIGANDYFTFILILGLGMGLLFELPIIILILTRLGIVTPQFLIRKRKIAIIAIFVIAAIITPQVDPLSQTMVAIPLMLLYEISIVISKFIFLRKKKREKEAENNLDG